MTISFITSIHTKEKNQKALPVKKVKTAIIYIRFGKQNTLIKY